ncbi:MAG TPA: response regulator [Bryobacteraceae bacterium]|nr:response regulator [Bryobacteraceae bacterium]
MSKLSNSQEQDRETEPARYLSAGIIHDLNNLLTVINGYNEILAATCELPEKARQCVAAVRSAGQRAATLAHALMTAGRAIPLDPRCLDANLCVSELVTLVRQLLPSNITISALLAPDLPAVIADPCVIPQVLLNLVMNSRDAMPGGGTLQVETAAVAAEPNSPHAFLPRGEYVLLSVKDSGAGMDEPTRRRIFEPFYSTKAPGSGSGLGLPMVQHVVRESGGFVAVESAEGSGTTVRIYLPAAQAGALPLTETAPSPAAAGNRESILVVEGDPDLRGFICDALAHAGYAVLEAESAKEAGELSSGLADSLELLIANLYLSGSSGPELAASLRQARPGLPALFISSEETKAGGGDVLSIPFTLSGLAGSVRAILDRQKRKRILLVDDNQQVLMFAAEVLRDAGYEVLVGEDGNVALSIAGREPLDLVITDLVMRDREGLDTMMHLRETHPELPVIAISGAFGGAFLRSAAILGARVTLAKPFSGEDLLDAVRKVLGS